MNTLPEELVIVISMNTLCERMCNHVLHVLFTCGMREKMSKKIASYFLHLSDSMLMKARELIESTLCTVIYRTAR